MTADPRKGWTTRIQNSSGTTLAGTPIIALHGFSGRGTDWSALRDGMKAHAWLTPDLPGHGPAPVIPADLDAHLAAVDRALGFFTEAPVLIGYSMGGRIALHAALDRQADFSALVLIGATPGLTCTDERAARIASDAALAAHIRQQTIAEFLSEWDSHPLLAGKALTPEPFKSRLLQARRQNTCAGLAASLDGVGTGVLHGLWEALPDFDIPVLLVTGERDTKFAAIAARMIAHAPHFQSVSIPGAGHAVHLEQPAATAAAIQEWLTLQSGTDR